MKKSVLVWLSLIFLSGCETAPRERLVYHNGQPYKIFGSCTKDSKPEIVTDNFTTCNDEDGEVVGYIETLTYDQAETLSLKLAQEREATRQAWQDIGDSLQDIGDSLNQSAVSMQQRNQQWGVPDVTQPIGGSNRITYNQVGTTLMGSNGISYRRTGNTVFGTDGTTCQITGSVIICQ
tara:strand:+ start:540 stop:1073 length:534 start_codon:yes stop_codon:yes gene_type:complete